MTYPITFGTYAFPAPHTVVVSKIGMSRMVPSAKIPRYDGARTLSGMLELKKISLQGTIFRPLGNTTPNYLRGVVDAFHAGLAQGPANFSIDTDRYWRQCQAESYSDDYDPSSFYNYVNITCDIVTGDPFSYEVTNRTAGGSLTGSGQTLAATAGGNAYNAPQIVLTVGSTGTLAATITNQTTGDVFTLNGAVTSGDVITIDSLLETVTRAGVDVTSLFDGMFPRLNVGSNTFLVEWTAGSLSHITVNWNNRYY